MNDIPYQTIDTRALHGLAQPDRIAPALYHDPALFEAELDRIFYRTWIWVAHDSELPRPGDFITTTIGRQPVIVVRDKTGEVNVLQNRCRHRGATVCEAHKGNAKGFTCPYHSWSYALDGTLRALPYGDGYEGVCDKGDLPLVKLRVGVPSPQMAISCCPLSLAAITLRQMAAGAFSRPPSHVPQGP